VAQLVENAIEQLKFNDKELVDGEEVRFALCGEKESGEEFAYIEFTYKPFVGQVCDKMSMKNFTKEALAAAREVGQIAAYVGQHGLLKII
jgi:hypothetical protein